MTAIKSHDLTKPAQQQRHPTGFSSSELVAVIDDDDAVRDSLATLLEANRFQVECFASGVEFLESTILSRTGCLLLDYHMPGMTGLDLLNELRGRGLSYPTILITGLADAAIVRRALAAGVLEVLKKPSAQNVVIEAVRRALRLSLPPTI